MSNASDIAAYSDSPVGATDLIILIYTIFSHMLNQKCLLLVALNTMPSIHKNGKLHAFSLLWQLDAPLVGFTGHGSISVFQLRKHCFVSL